MPLLLVFCIGIHKYMPVSDLFSTLYNWILLSTEDLLPSVSVQITCIDCL